MLLNLAEQRVSYELMSQKLKDWSMLSILNIEVIHANL